MVSPGGAAACEVPAGLRGWGDSDVTWPPHHAKPRAAPAEKVPVGWRETEAGCWHSTGRCPLCRVRHGIPVPWQAGTVGTGMPCPILWGPPSPKSCCSAWAKSYSRVTPAVPVPAALQPSNPIPSLSLSPLPPMMLGWHSAPWHSQEGNKRWPPACQHTSVPRLAAGGLPVVRRKGIVQAPCLARLLLPAAGLPVPACHAPTAC